MNRFLSLALSLLGALLLTSTASAYSRAGSSAPSAQTATYQASPFAAFASATDSSPNNLARRLRHPLGAIRVADINAFGSSTPGQNPGWLIGEVILIGVIIFGLTHLRKS